MSALPPKADIVERDRHVRFVPKADTSPTNQTQLPNASRPQPTHQGFAGGREDGTVSVLAYEINRCTSADLLE